MKTALIMLLISIIACTNSEQNKPDTARNTTKDDTGLNMPGTVNKNDSVIRINFTNGSNSVTVAAKMNGLDHPVTVYIPIEKGKQLSALLIVEDSLANIRFNQIFTPDGKADGPFGKELNRLITQPGTYKLIIAENQMQGEEWKGEFKLSVKVHDGKIGARATTIKN